MATARQGGPSRGNYLYIALGFAVLSDCTADFGNIAFGEALPRRPT